MTSRTEALAAAVAAGVRSLAGRARGVLALLVLAESRDAVPTPERELAARARRLAGPPWPRDAEA